jgi:hypothetical protein
MVAEKHQRGEMGCVRANEENEAMRWSRCVDDRNWLHAMDDRSSKVDIEDAHHIPQMKDQTERDKF